jgi:tetratricopeptide (TPR) repeat protein
MDYWMRKAGRRGTGTTALKTALRYARTCGDGDAIIKILHEFGFGQKLIREGNFAELGETLEQLFDYSAGDTLATPEDLGLELGTGTKTIGVLVGLLAESYFKRGRFGDATSLIEWLMDYGQGSVMHRCLLAQMMASTDEVHLAEAIALDALAEADTRKDASGKLEAFGLLGFIYSQVGSVAKALEAYAQALELSKELKNLGLEALTESRIGLVLWVSGDVVSARPHFQRGFDLARKVRDPYLVGLATGNFGHYYQDKPDLTAKDLQIAEGHYRRALDIHERTGVRRGQGYWHGQLGRIELAHGNTEDALMHLRRALLIHRAIGERAAMARHLWYLGLVHAVMGDATARNGLLSLALDELESTHNFVELEARKREINGFGYTLDSDQLNLSEIRDDYAAFLDGESSFGVRSFLHWVHDTEFSPV